MPLNDGYGVVIGTLHNCYRDPVSNCGQYYQSNVAVQSPAGLFRRRAIDVDSKSLPNDVACRAVQLRKPDLWGIMSLLDGWHDLATNPASVALDYIRSEELPPRVGSKWWGGNGIWQDGATVIQRQGGKTVAFLNEFKIQAYQTDVLGYPS
jgi:hypothetical protein